MIKIDNIKIFNLARAVYSARNALNSWAKSDSDLENDILGEADLGLAMKLANAGSDDRKFLRQIIVSMDILAPFYWWKEYDTYKVGTVANSCSTMHRIHSNEFRLSDFSWEHLDEPGLQLMEAIIDYLNHNRKLFNETKDKQYWHNMIQILPTSYNQLRTVTLNYEVLRNMYHARKHHKLAEWRELCKRIESLPYSQLITGEEKGERNER